jgi:hypothetical protein
MSGLKIELCSETGICSILKGGAKVDLAPDEVGELRAAGWDGAKARKVISDVDAEFAATLTDTDLRLIAVKTMPKGCCCCSG